MVGGEIAVGLESGCEPRLHTSYNRSRSVAARIGSCINDSAMTGTTHSIVWHQTGSGFAMGNH